MTAPEADSFVVTGVRVRHIPGREILGDLHVSGGVLVRAEASRQPERIAVDGAYAVPLMVASAVARRPESERRIYDLVPGNPATFALVRRPVSDSQIRDMLVVDPEHLIAVYVNEHLEAWQGEPTRSAGEDLSDPGTRGTWVGTWDDPGRRLRQHLLPDGRYSETRGGRKDAYTGRYWIRDGRITYLDDSGFWAFGELLDGTLHHAGFVMTRR